MRHDGKTNDANGDGVCYQEVLDRAHKEGLKDVQTRLLQAPDKENQFTAITYAKVRTNKGTFTGLGDASPTNVTPEYAPHFIRVAETRAKARALRDALNVGVAAVEELGHPANGRNTGDQPGQQKAVSEPSKPNGPDGDQRGQAKPAEPKPQEPLMTERQRSYLFRILAQRGFEKDVAHEEIKRIFQVASLS